MLGWPRTASLSYALITPFRARTVSGLRAYFQHTLDNVKKKNLAPYTEVRYLTASSKTLSQNVLPKSPLPHPASSENKTNSPLALPAPRWTPSQYCIKLTETEQKIFELLLKVVEHFGNVTTVRVAGGWVRDKLLGIESQDIDITLDNVSGALFAYQIRQYLLLENKLDHRSGLVSLTKLNPDQSKHLETAIMKILGVELNFVQARSDKYNSTSRIPSISVGTSLLEDAQRRDFTVNSLYYNVNANTLEDYTGKGWQDLLSGIIDTPLEPFLTLKDDPLRALRAIRFAARFRYTLSQGLFQSISNVYIHQMLKTKVTRSRIGLELKKMLVNSIETSSSSSCLNDPIRALELLVETNLYSSVFQLDDMSQSFDAWNPHLAKQSLDTVRLTHHLLNLEALQQSSPIDQTYHSFMLIATFIFPLVKKFRRDSSALRSAIWTFFNKLQLSRIQSRACLETIECAYTSIDVIDALCPNKAEISADQDALEHAKLQLFDEISNNFQNFKVHQKVVRWMNKSPDHWTLAVYLSRILRGGTPGKNAASILIEPPNLGRPAFRALFILEETFIEFILKKQLDKARNLQPHLSGREVIDLTGIPQGPKVGKIINRLLLWQLTHLESTKEEAVAFLLENPASDFSKD